MAVHGKPARLVALAAALVFCACSKGGGHHHGIPVFHESEPNDSAWNPDWIGTVGPGAILSIRGTISDLGPDLLDGFAFRTAAPCDVEFALWPDAVHADLDLCVYDPVLDLYTLCFETGAVPESGVFTLPGGYDFHLVVSSYFGASGYTLDVRVGPPSSLAATAGDAPRGDPESARLRARYLRGGAAREDQTEAPAGRPGVLIEVDGEGNVRSAPVELLPLVGGAALVGGA